MTYADAVEWAIDNVPMDFYDSYEEWLDASKNELQTPELVSASEFNKRMQRAWENEVGDIKKTRQQLEQEEREQTRIDELEVPEEPEVIEPTAKEVEQELSRNIPTEPQPTTRIVTKTVITESQTPVEIESNTPITIRRLPPTGRAPIITPLQITRPSEPIKPSGRFGIFKRFFARLRGKKQ